MSQRAEPAITFRDLTLGYDRHPAVHHVTGEVAQGELLALVGPNGAGKSTLLKGMMGEIKPLDGSIDLSGLSHRDIAYLPQQIDIDRSFPISVFDCMPWGCGARSAHWRGLDAGAQAQGRRALDAVGMLDLANRASARSPAGSSSACCSPACCCRTPAHPARRAVPRRRCQDRRRPLRLIRRWHARRPHSDRRAARHRAGARAFRQDAAARPRGRGLGRYAESADARKSRQGAPRGRGLGGACRGSASGTTRSRSASRHDRRRSPAFRRVRLHAPGACRLLRAVARRAADRRVPHAAAHEPDGRRHEPRHPARRRGRLSCSAGCRSSP